MFISIYEMFVGERSTLIANIFLPFLSFDIILKFFVTYYRDVQEVRNIFLIAYRYCRTYFFIDVCATMPFYFFNTDYLYLRLFRLIRFRQYLSQFSKLIESVCIKYFNFRKEVTNNLTKFTTFFLLLSLTVHLFGSMWVYIGILNGKEGWIEQKLDLLDATSRDTLPRSRVYIASLYWVMTTFTTVGYGDIAGHANNEYLYQMLVEIIGIGFFAYLMGNINSLFVQVDSIYELKAAKEEELELWLIRLDKSVKQKVLLNEYFTHIQKFFSAQWDKNFHSLKNEEFFWKMKPQLQNELIDYLFKDFLDFFKFFFEGLQIGFRRAVLKNLKFKIYESFPPYDDKYKEDKSIGHKQDLAIIRKGEVPKYVHFILRGEVFVTNATGNYKYFALLPRSFFGECHLLFGMPSSYSYTVDEGSAVHTLRISGKTFLRLCKSYPQSGKLLVERSLERRRIFRAQKLDNLRRVIDRILRKQMSSINMPSVRAAESASSVKRDNSAPGRASKEVGDHGEASPVSSAAQTVSAVNTVTPKRQPSGNKAGAGPQDQYGTREPFGVTEEEQTLGRALSLKRRVQEEVPVTTEAPQEGLEPDEYEIVMGEDEEEEARSEKLMEFVPIPQDESKVIEEEEEEEKHEQAPEKPGHHRKGTESQIMEEEEEEFMGGETEEMQVPQFHPKRTATYNLNGSPRGGHSEMKEDEESEELEEDEEDEEEGKEEFDETVRKYTKEQLLERFEKAKIHRYNDEERFNNVRKIMEKTNAPFNLARNELFEEYFFNSEEGEADTLTGGGDNVQINSVFERQMMEEEKRRKEDQELSLQDKFVTDIVANMKEDLSAVADAHGAIERGYEQKVKDIMNCLSVMVKDFNRIRKAELISL